MVKIQENKGQITIDFVNDTFGPYEHKFGREDCYYNDSLNDRGAVLFPYKNKKFNNTEIFLETSDVIICTGERSNLSGEEKKFIDIINIKTEKKQRLFVDEVSLIYNSENQIIVNANFSGVWKTVKLNHESLEIEEEKEEKLYAFFKSVYNETEDSWGQLIYDGISFQREGLENIQGVPSIFDRQLFTILFATQGDIYKERKIPGISQFVVSKDNSTEFSEKIDVWDYEADGEIEKAHINFLNSQNYVIGKGEKKQVLTKYFYDKVLDSGLFYASILRGLMHIVFFIPIAFLGLVLIGLGEILLFIPYLFLLIYILLQLIRSLKATKFASIREYLFFGADTYINYILWIICLALIVYGAISLIALYEFMFYIFFLPFVLFYMLTSSSKVRYNVPNFLHILMLPFVFLLTIFPSFFYFFRTFFVKTPEVSKLVPNGNMREKFVTLADKTAENGFYKIRVR